MEDESAAPRLTAVSSLSDPQALIDRLARRRPAPAEALQRRRPADLPLSFGQERFWFLEQLDPGNPVHAVSGLVRIRGAPAPAVLQDSFSELVRRHEILRTRFVEHAGYGSQLIDPPVPFALEVVDLSSLAVSEREAEARRLGESVAAAPFDLGAGVLMRARLFRLSADEHLAVVAMHHIIADGWSMGVLVRELGAIYSAFAHGRPSPLAELAVHYADYALWQRARLAGPVLQRHIDYWREALTGAPLTLPLTTDRPRPNVQSFRGARFTFSLGADLTAALKLLAARERVTPYMVLLAAYQIVLARQSGQDDLLVGSPVAGRGRPDLEGQIGFFVNSVVLRARVAADATLAEHLQQVKATALGAYAHQELPFDKVVELLQPDRDLSRHPIFQVWITYQNTPQTAFDFEGVAIEFLAAAHVRAMFDLSLFVEEAEEGLACALEYAADLFDASTMERFSGQLRRVLEQMASDLGVRVGAVDLLDPAERTQVLEAWNATAMACPSGTLHELISVGALAWPDSVAAVCGDEALSYAELERRSNQLARRLQGLGVGPDMVVGLCVERSLEMVVGLLGILKAGGAYLPLDPEYPAERLAFMLQDAAAPVVLTQAALDERLPSHWGRTLCLDADWPSVAALPDTPVASGAGPQNLAYVIYTSGSTGRPKGVMLTHAAAVNHMSWMAACHPLGGDDAVLQKTSVSFDASVWELFAPLLEGARLVLPPGDEARDFDRLRAAVEGGGVTRVQFVPAALGAYLEGAAGGSRLRDVFCGGSVLTSGLREAVAAKLGCRLHNLYGPTEACIDATWHSCAEDEQGPSPIGRPIWNMRAYVLDAGLQPVPVGVAGELWLAGAGLARGYLGRAALTAERFVACPFGPAGERMYRTGDLARWRANGTLDYLGRLDEQVKVRGFRIELGDIEHALSAHGDVAQCAVQAQPDGGDLRLVAYVAPKLGAELDAGALRTHLGRSLPGYMLPQQYVVLEGLPRLANGKLDRKALPDADGARPAAGYTAPRTATEETLAALWADVLGRPQIGVHDNFFDLGGDSIKSIQIVARARIALGVNVALSLLFEAPTVAEFADRLPNLQNAAGGLDSEDILAPLLPLHTHGEGPPIFCVHPAIGFSWCYSRLVQALEGRHPIYGLQATAFAGRPEFYASVSDMASDYVRRIREVQPTGPYHLIGYSFGGLVAHEMARLLQAAGERIGLLGIADTEAMEATGRQRPDDASLATNLFKFLRLDGTHLVQDGAVDVVDLVTFLIEQQQLPDIFSADDAEFLVKIYRGVIDLEYAFSPGVVDGDVIYFAATHESLPWLQRMSSWGPHVRGRIDVSEIDSDHADMFTGPAVNQIAATLRTRLAAAAEQTLVLS
jgi:amino acid adenylation domain-containing protein